MGYGHEDFGYRLWDPVSKKIIRSRDVIFIEDQTIEDLEKTDKPTVTVRRSVDDEPGPSTRPPVDGGDVQVDNDGDDLHDEPTPQSEVPDVEVPPEPPVEPELRRSTRERHPSQKYSPHEYVIGGRNCDPLCICMRFKNWLYWNL